MYGRMNTVINRNPTKKEAKAALGTKRIVRGHGIANAVPRTKNSLVTSALTDSSSLTIAEAKYSL